MATDPESWRRRKQAVARRAAAVDPSRHHCGAEGCRNLTRAAAGKGLNRSYCKAHEEQHQRHGSPHKGSYSADRLNPYRRAAFDWLTANAEDPWVKRAIGGVMGLYHKAGPAVAASSLRGLKPEERSRVAWARLRKAEIDPRLPLSAWIAIEMITRDDPQAVTTTEYKRVQAAKVVHRIVSGTHKRWEVPRSDGGVTITELHKFPVSRGRVLRHIGKQIERVAELVVDMHLTAIANFKKEREGAGKPPKRPHPGRIKGLPMRAKRSHAPKPPAPKPPQPVQPSGPKANRRAPRTVTLPDGTIVTYN